MPLDDRLAVEQPDTAAAARSWAEYARRWTRWNRLRSLAALAAAAAHVAVLVVRGASLAEDGRPGVDVNGRTDATPAPESVAPVLRERIYGTVACLSTLLALVGHLDAETSAWSAVVDVAVANGSLWAASVFADVVAHITAHGRTPGAGEALRTLRASGQILAAAAAPLLLLVVAGLDGMSLPTALQVGSWICVVTLGLFALLAARRTPLPGWKRAILVATLIALGVVVVVVKTLAHG